MITFLLFFFEPIQKTKRRRSGEARGCPLRTREYADCLGGSPQTHRIMDGSAIRLLSRLFIIGLLLSFFGLPTHGDEKGRAKNGATGDTVTFPSQEPSLDEPIHKDLNPFAGDEEAIRSGGVLFRQLCAACHGVRGQGGKGPDLTDPRWLHGSSDADIFRVIRSGVRGTLMKELSPVILDHRVWKLIAFVRSLARSAADPEWQPDLTGNPAAGRKLFLTSKAKRTASSVTRWMARAAEWGRPSPESPVDELRNSLWIP